jgi:hypothetical protein
VDGQPAAQWATARVQHALPGHLERVDRGHASSQDDVGFAGSGVERVADVASVIRHISDRGDPAAEPLRTRMQRGLETPSRGIAELLANDDANPERGKGANVDH